MTASRLTRRSAVALGALLLAAPAFAPNAQPVRLIVGYSAGGPVDAAARQIAPVLSKELGLQVIVENKPGANATIAGDTVAKAAPDGHTLWFAASPTMTISPNVINPRRSIASRPPRCSTSRRPATRGRSSSTCCARASG